MLLVEEYLGTPRPDPDLLPLYSGNQPPELVEMPDEEDEDTDEEDDLQQRVILQNRAGSRGPARVMVPPTRVATRAPTPSSRPSVREIIEMAPEPLFVGKRAEPLRIALPGSSGEEPSLVLAAAAPEDYDEDSAWDESEDVSVWDEDASEEEDSDIGASAAATIAVGGVRRGAGASLRLSLDSNEEVDDLRNLEERRRFDTPIWGPSPNATRFDADISLFDESDDEEDESDGNLFGGASADQDDAFVFDEEEDIRAFHQARRPAFVLDEADDLDEPADAAGQPPMAAVRISPFARDDMSETIGIDGDPLDPPELAEWESPAVVPIRRVALPSEPAPETDPVRSYGILAEDEPSQSEEIRVSPAEVGATPLVVPPPRPAPEAPARPSSDEPAPQRGATLIWALGAITLLSVGGWAAYVLVEQLSVPVSALPAEVLPATGDPLPPDDGTTPDGAAPEPRPPSPRRRPPAMHRSSWAAPPSAWT